jgi:hypothetical protein
MSGGLGKAAAMVQMVIRPDTSHVQRCFNFNDPFGTSAFKVLSPLAGILKFILW